VVKICRIGTVTVGWGGRRASMHIKIIMPRVGGDLFSEGISSYADDFDLKRTELSITGVIGALPNGNALGGCGQICMEFAHRNPADNDKRYVNPIQPSEINFAKGWNAEKWYELLDIWHKYHLKKLSEVPISVKKFLLDLPDADKMPAWV
jgi:hypothetical protein